MIASRIFVAAALLLAVAAFALDWWIPLGVAGGLPYAAAVLCAWGAGQRDFAVVLAVACVGATCLALALAFPAGPVWQVVLNRVLAAAAIGAAAWLGGLLWQTRSALAKAHEELDRRGQQRAAELAAANEELRGEIAERLRMERALRDSEALHTSLVEDLPMAIIRKDRAGRFTFVNRPFCRLLGKRSDEIQGRTDFDFFPRELAEKYRVDDRRVMDTQHVFEDIEANQGPDGRQRFVQVLKTPVYDAEGKVIGVQCAFWDVTDRKRAEQSMRESETRKRAMFEAALDCIIFSDAEGRIVEFNRAAEKTFGYRRNEVMGRDMAQVIFPTDSQERHRDSMSRYAGGGEVGSLLARRLEVTAHRKSGEQFVAEMAMQPIPLDGTVGFAIFLQDITDRKQAEAALRLAKDEAEAANRAKSLFVANMSHEIRTPLNAVIGITDLLLGTQLTAEQREYLAMVQDSGESLLAVINDILDFSKIEAGKLDLEDAAFDLRERIGDTLRSLAFRAHNKGLELACHIHPDTPAVVRGDPNRLRQVIVNLVGNAIKFTEQGEVVLDVDQRSRDNGAAELHFAVRDTGPGIPRDKLQTIFGAFEQADNTMTRRFGGTGLGLAISTKLVELMGGRVWVQSELGEGSTFHFTARLHLAGHPDAQPRALQAAELSGKRVLVVDDNATNRSILGEMLANWGLAAHTTEAAPRALEQLRAHAEGKPFDLLLIDANMPGMDGFALVEKIRNGPAADCPVIMMLTSGDRPGDIARCEELGIADHLLKPVKQSELFDAVVARLGEEAGPVRAARPGRSRRRPSLHVLLAEDALVNQKLAVGLLKRYGHRVTVADTGRMAVEALKNEDFDLVLMDVQMPEMDGLEATRRIRAQERSSGRHVPIVAMTAHAMKGDREQCLQAGMDGYLAKPIRAAELVAAIASIATKAGSGAAKPPAADTLVDWDVALETVHGDRDLLREVVTAFLQEAPERTGELHQAVAEGDPKLLCRAAHTIKSSMRYFGLDDAFQLAGRLEIMGKEGNLNGAAALATQLDARLEQLTGELQSFANRERPDDNEDRVKRKGQQ